MRRLLLTLSLIAFTSCQAPKSAPPPAPPSSSATQPSSSQTSVNTTSSDPSSATQPANSGSGLLSGTIEIDDSVKSSADPLSVIFVIARNEQDQIVAVKKLLPPFQWPVTYSLNQGDVMIAGTELSGKLKLSARLDKDGNANPSESGDIVGKTESDWVKPGDRGVTVYLFQVVP